MIPDDKIKVLATYQPRDALRRILNANPAIRRHAIPARHIVSTIKWLDALAKSLGWHIIVEQGEYTAVPFAKVAFKDKEGCAFTTCWLPVKEAIKPMLYMLFYSGGRVIDLEYVEELAKRAADAIFQKGPSGADTMVADHRRALRDAEEADRITEFMRHRRMTFAAPTHKQAAAYIIQGATA